VIDAVTGRAQESSEAPARSTKAEPHAEPAREARAPPAEPAVVARGLEARARIRGLPSEDRVSVLLRALRSSEASAARRLAARELAADPAHRGARVTSGLARAAMVDGFKSVRDRSLLALREVSDPNTAKHFVPGLSDRRPEVRTRAANAISVFPDRAVVPDILATMRMTWVGFGRANTLQVTQRAYIADYELVSGGTGFSIIEVADPVVQTSLEGVALDVDVRRVELIARLRALHRITGQDFGTDLRAWEEWWAKNGGR
jgi:hypothetical protein